MSDKVKMNINEFNNEIKINIQNSEGVGMNIKPTGVGGTKDHSKLINRDLEDQHPISSITGLQETINEFEEALENTGKVKDVRVDNQSVVSQDGIANVPSNYVKYSANQELTDIQKNNARNNIEALGRNSVKQSTGDSTIDVISQKGVTDLLNEKQNNKPNGVNLLISDDTGKIDLVYIPSTVLGGITNAGTFNSEGIIQASSYAPELNGLKIDTVELQSYPSYYFICSGRYSFAGYSFDVGDWAISLGNGWAKLNATDAVTSVNGKMGQVVLNSDDVGATKKSWGSDNKNKNLVTDEEGNVTVSDYALGQIIVDYYEELPTNVPQTARASVINSSKSPLKYNAETIREAIENQTLIKGFEPNPKPIFYEVGTLDEPIDEYCFFMDKNYEYNYGVTFSQNIGLNSKCLQVDDGKTGDSYIYSWENQKYIDEVLDLVNGWNRLYYDTETGEMFIEPFDAKNLPYLSDLIPYDLYVEDTRFFDMWYDTKLNLAGDYVYTEVQPTTEPKSYYWKHIPANTQADMDETDPLSLAFIKNKRPRGYLDTNNSNSLEIPESPEVLENIVKLHKISKTGKYEDLIDRVGIKDIQEETPEGTEPQLIGGEVFNEYTGKNVATGDYSHAEGYNTQALSNSSHSEGIGTVTNDYAQHVEGKYNEIVGDVAHIVGAGTSDNSRKNIHELDWDGNAWYEGNIYIGNKENKKVLAKLEDLRRLAVKKSLTFTNQTSFSDAYPLPIGSIKFYPIYNEESIDGLKSLSYTFNDNNTVYVRFGTNDEACALTTGIKDYIYINGKNEIYLKKYTKKLYCQKTSSTIGTKDAKPNGIIRCSNTYYTPVLNNKVIDFGGIITDNVYVLYELEEPVDVYLSSTLITLETQSGNNNIKITSNQNVQCDIEYFGPASASGSVQLKTIDDISLEGTGNIPVKTVNGKKVFGESGDIVIEATSKSKKKELRYYHTNYTYENGIITVTDADVNTNTNIDLYPANEETEAWLQENLTSSIIKELEASFTFKVKSTLPVGFGAYYIITEVKE